MNVWPAKVNYYLSGWNVRVSEGITKRANSVLPNMFYGEDPEITINLVEKLYLKQNLPTIFQIADKVNPNNLDTILASRDYKKESLTDVLYSPIINLVDKPPEAVGEVIYSNNPSQKWLQTNQSFLKDPENVLKGKKAIFSRIIFPKPFYSSLFFQNSCVGVALGIIDQELMGIYEVVISEEYRNQGLATLLMTKIDFFAKTKVKGIFLQVVQDNTPAKNLYTKLGYKKLYSYHYRVKKDH